MPDRRKLQNNTFSPRDEPLEERTLLSVNPLLDQNASEVANVLYTDSFDNGVEIGAFWNGANANVTDGNLVISNGTVFASKPEQDLTPSAESPVKIEADLRLDGNGVRIVTRYDGNYLGDGEYKNGMAFIIEYNSAGIYLYDEDGNTRLFDENGARSYTSIPKLSTDQTYAVQVIDTGTYASLKIMDGDQEIVCVDGAVKEEPAGGRVAMEKFGSGSIFIDSMEVSHGTKKIQVDPEPEPAPENNEPQIVILDPPQSPKVDTQAILDKAENLDTERNTVEESVNQTKSEIEALEALLAKKKAELVELEAELTVAQEDLREAVTYSRMFVAEDITGADGNSADVRFSTDFDAVTFVMEDGTNRVEQTFEHVGGEADKAVTIKLPKELVGVNAKEPGKSQYLKMLDPDGNVLDQVWIRKGKVDAPQNDWSELETGLLEEHPVIPDVQIAAINGTAIVAATSTPFDDIRLEVDGGGIMSDRVIEREGGTELVMAQMFFDGSNVPGTYEVDLKNSKEITLDTLSINWDGEEISLTDVGDRWSPEPQIVGMMARGNETVNELAYSVQASKRTVDVFANQTELKSTNVDGYPQFREYQESELYRLSKFSMDREALDEAYYQKRPEMRNVTDDQSRRMRGDAMQSNWENLEVYKGAVGRILKFAVDVYFDSQRGGNQQEAIARVENEIGIWGGVRKICELKIETGIELPTVDEAMAEALRIYEQNIGTFYVLQEMSNRQHHKQEYQALSRYWQIVHAGQPDGPATLIANDSGSLYASASNTYDTNATNINTKSETIPRRVARVNRRIAEMERQADSGGYVDPRFQQWREVRDTPNVQRERWQEEIDQVFSLVAEDAGQTDVTNAMLVEEDPLRPSVAWAEEQVADLGAVVDVAVEGIRMEEQLRFGEKLAMAIEINPQWLDPDFGKENTENEEELLSYIVSRPFGIDVFHSHNFIVTDAKFLGDPNATIYTFAKNESGNLGRVFDKVHKRDRTAWESLTDKPIRDDSLRIYHSKIPANNELVRTLALTLLEDLDYDLTGPNCNSAAQAIANVAAKASLVPPSMPSRFPWGHEDFDLIDFGDRIGGNPSN